MIERALVTGGAGFIGANLVDRLIDDGADVLVIDDLSSGKLDRLSRAREAHHVQVHQIDIRDERLPEVLARFGPDVVFHLAAQTDTERSFQSPDFDASVNVVGTVNVLAAAIASGVGRVVFASSGGAVFGKANKIPTPERSRPVPLSPYGVSKLVADEYLRYFHRKNGLHYVSLGCADVYGPRQASHEEAGIVAFLTRTLLSGERPLIFGDGTQERDFVFVEDVTDAFVRAAEYDGGVYLNIGTGVGTSVNALFDKLCELTGKRVRPLYKGARDGEMRYSVLDVAAAERTLGWKPWTSLDEGLALTVEHFVSEVAG